MSKKKKSNIFLKILGAFFVLFMALFIANMSGYYESKIRERVLVTEEGIKEFEKKVQTGEDVDITSFLKTEQEDYSSSISSLGENLTIGIENIVSGSLEFVGNVLNSLF